VSRAVSPSGRPDVVVVGGGIIGLAVAWRAAATGRRVAVVDPAPGRGATWAAAGMLAPVAEAHFGEGDLARLNLAAAGAWPGFARELESAAGREVHYRDDGTLVVAGGPSDRAATDRVLAFHLAMGLPADRLGPAACRAAEPLLAPGVSGGVDLPADHQVDNREVALALESACRAAGVSFVVDRVARVEVADGRVLGVVPADGEPVPADAVVLAAGCRSGAVAGVPEAWRPPVRPVRGATVRLRAPDGAPRLTRTVRALVHGRSCYLVPRDDGGLVLGATVEERGFGLDVPLGGVADLVEDARRIVPALDEYELVEVAPGLRPGSPDNGPIVGPTRVDGLLVATGHHRNGVLLAPATADEVIRLLVARSDGADAPPGPFDAFRPARFVGAAVGP